MAVTYSQIATTTANGSVSSITFSSISGSYTDLIIIQNSKGAATTAGTWLRLNSDTGTNYSRTRILGDGSSASSGRQNNETAIQGDSPQNEWGTSIWQINNYSNATTYKTVLWRDNSNTYVAAQVGLWRSTSAITSITLSTNSSATNFASGSTFSLYGIKAA